MKYLVIIFILLGFTSHGQSKGDTQIWIKSTIENYYRRDVYNPLLNVVYNEGDIWFVELDNGGSYQRELPIKKINQVLIQTDSKGYVLILGCSFEQACCRIVRYKMMPDGSAEKVVSNESNRTGVKIFLQKSLENDNMVARLKKAFTHLILLNGGKVISETF
jgi:metal-dependent hydrolase (beta-lactamase superfamily II)